VFCTLRHKTNLKMGRRTGRTRPWADGREPFKGYRTGRSETRIRNLRGAATADAITMGSLLRVLRGSLNFKDSVTLLTVSIVIFTHRMSKCTAYLCNIFRHARSHHISLVITFSYRASAAGFEMQVQHEPQSTVACGSVGVLRLGSDPQRQAHFYPHKYRTRGRVEAGQTASSHSCPRAHCIA
jgi:hypothetical protein